MAVKRAPSKKARADQGRKPKKNPLIAAGIEYVDYKDVNLLTRFVSDRSKIRNRRVTGNTVQQQRDIANAIKNSREMALLPYTKRVAQTRTSRPPRDGDSRRGRDDAPQRESQVAGGDIDVMDLGLNDIDLEDVEGVTATFDDSVAGADVAAEDGEA